MFVTLVATHAQYILVNHKVKGCLYMSPLIIVGPVTVSPNECACAKPLYCKRQVQTLRFDRLSKRVRNQEPGIEPANI